MGSFAEDKRTDFTPSSANKAEVAALTTGGGATQIGNILYLGGAQDLGPGTPINVAFLFTTAYAASGSGTLTLALEVANEAAFDTTNETVWTSGAVAEATIVKGYKLLARLRNKGKKYIRVLGTAGTENASAGVMSAQIKNEMGEAGETTTPTTPTV